MRRVRDGDVCASHAHRDEAAFVKVQVETSLSKDVGRVAPVVISALVILTLGSALIVHASASGSLDLSPPRAAPSGLSAVGSPAAMPQVEPAAARTAAGGGEARLIVNTTDRTAVPNTGLRVNITAYLAGTLSTGSAFQVGAEEVIGTYAAVFGIFQNSQRYPVPFFSVFSNVTDQTVHLAYWSNITLAAGSSYEFVLTATAGTLWTLTMNGALFADNASDATFNFGATDATWSGGLSFSEIAFYSSTSPTPSEVDVPLAFAVLETGGWYLPHQGATYALAPSALTWGALGRLQRPTLAPGEIVTGSSVPPVANGTTLWSGGPVPVGVTVTPSRGAAPSIYPVAVAAAVHASNGSLLPGVALDWSDSIGGVFTPAEVTTNGTGSATTAFATPNVSLAEDDLVQARVTLFGYVGFGAASIHLTPAVQLFLQAVPPTLTVDQGATLNMSFRAANGTGGLVGGVLLIFSTSRGTFDSSPFAVTDGTGSAWVRIVAPSPGSSFTIRAAVSAPGYWGHQSVNVTVVIPAPSLFSKVEPYVVGAIAGMAVALVAVLLLRERRRRRAIPTLKFLTEMQAAPDRESPPTRTPP